MIQEKTIVVTNPETGEKYDCTAIVDQLEILYESKSTEEFNKNLELLKSCFKWTDTIEKQIRELKNIFILHGISKKFYEQLNNVIKYASKEKEENTYQPIQERFKELYLAKTKQKGISFLCPPLDELTGGIQPGTICTIAGGPGSMKTTIAVNIAYQAVKDGKNVLYLSLEETTLQLFSKLLARVSVDIQKPLNINDITQSKLSSEDQTVLFDKVLPYLENLSGSFQMIGDNDLASYEFSHLESKFKLIDKYFKNKHNDDHGIDLIVVDHIQLLKYASSTKDEYKVMNEYVAFFRKQSLSFLGEDRQISVILLSQVNREGIGYAQRHDGMYQMQHVAEASEVERASSYIISTYTDAMAQVTKHVKIGTIKLRNASLPMDTINVYAEGAYYQVGDVSVREQQDYNMDDINNVDNLKENLVAKDILAEFNLNEKEKSKIWQRI